MTRVLVLSSMVAHGHVGLSAALPALQALGITTTGIPTTVLSNHPAWPYVAGTAVSAHQVSAMVRALRSNGWLRGIDAVLTGYLPTPDHVIEAAALIDTVRAESPMARIVVDPVLGDTPKGLYLPEPTAKALRDRLLPLAEVITPNAFELGWLSGAPVETPADLTKAARTLLDRHPQRGMTVIATSAPAMAHRIATVSVSASETQRWTVLRKEAVPQGTGDVFAALIAAGLSTGQALGHLDALVSASTGTPHLSIAEAARHWTAAPALAPEN